MIRSSLRVISASLVLAACSSSVAPGGSGTHGSTSSSSVAGSGSGGHGQGGAGGGGGGGGAGCSAASPSGYQCDPWSVHLYVTQGFERMGQTLRIHAVHNPDYEGSPSDQSIPPAHSFSQLLVVDIPFTTAVHDFLCVVLTHAAGAAPVDASSASFLTDVMNHPDTSLLADGSGDFMPHVTTLEAVCAGSKLTPVAAPVIATTAQPVLPDFALAIPLSPSPQGLKVGDTLDPWLSRGFLFVDEDRELVPRVHAKVVSVQ